MTGKIEGGAFHPYDDRTQPARMIPGYLKSTHRTPEGPPVSRILSTADWSGPVGPHDIASTGACDLSIVGPSGDRAIGQLVIVTGRVLDEDGRAVRNAVIEVWQANSAGRYAHQRDPSPAPLDPHFHGVGRLLTDANGRYSIRTIKPGAYAVPNEGPGAVAGWWRPPHVHFSLFGREFTSRLITQMYFPGEPLNARDLLLNSIPDARARDRLICRFAPHLTTADGALGFTHDFVLRGRHGTPFERR